MTHTLHRQGTLESLRGDYVWLMYQAKGINDTNIKAKAEEFIAAAEAARCENWGDVKSGSILELGAENVKARITDKSRLRGVFTKRAQVVEFLRRMKAREVGLSVVISGLLDEVLPACAEAGVTPHTINYSFGVWGKKELLPDDNVLSVSTMCGHHQISPKIIEFYRERVRQGKMEPERAALKLASLCPCGIFNHVRAAKLLAGED
jgi:DNA-binding transcriptional regulator YhcF (GntR family)